MRRKNVLILTSSGGSGHLKAAEAKWSEVKAQHPDAHIVQKDLVIDWISPTLGGYFVSQWNRAQKEGDFKTQEKLIDYLKVADKVLFLPIFIQTLLTLLREDIDQVIDTQPVGTSAVIKAIKSLKKLKGKKVSFEKVVTELPTKEVSHFFRAIKVLSKKDRRLLRLVTTHPLLGDAPSSSHFWQEHCGLAEHQVSYSGLPLRPHFKQARHRALSKTPLHLLIETPFSEQQRLILKAARKNAFPLMTKEDSIEITISTSSFVSVIMLGSHPDEKGTCLYVEKLIELMLHDPSKREELLFVFCGNEESSKNSLIEKIASFTTQSNYPKKLTLFPLPFQKDHFIAPLLKRSNRTITRSGGMTAMELLSVCDGEIFIHSNLAPKEETIDLFHLPANAHRMPSWEMGNAHYLKEKKGALLTTPSLLKAHLISRYKSKRA